MVCTYITFTLFQATIIICLDPNIQYVIQIYFSYNYPYWYQILCLFVLTHIFYHLKFESCLQNSAVLFLVMCWNVNKSFKLIDRSIIFIKNGKIIHFMKLSNMALNVQIRQYLWLPTTVLNFVKTKNLNIIRQIFTVLIFWLILCNTMRSEGNLLLEKQYFSEQILWHSKNTLHI